MPQFNDAACCLHAVAADARQGVFFSSANRADLVVDFGALEPDSWKLVSRIFESKAHTPSAQRAQNAGNVRTRLDYFTNWLGFASNLALQPFEQK